MLRWIKIPKKEANRPILLHGPRRVAVPKGAAVCNARIHLRQVKSKSAGSTSRLPTYRDAPTGGYFAAFVSITAPRKRAEEKEP